MSADKGARSGVGDPTGDCILAGVRPYGGHRTDVTIRAGRIAAMEPAADRADGDTATPTQTVIDARDLILLPGLVDLHTHLREPGGEESETIATGARAAAAGGFTDVFAMANTYPVTDDADRIREVKERSREQTSARVHPVGAITRGLRGTELAPLEDMAAAGARVFSDDGKCVNDSALMRRAFRSAAANDVTIAQHAQDGPIAGDGQINAGPVAETTGLPPWPSVAEHIIIARDALLAAEFGAHLHVCHLSTRGSVDIVRWAKSQGWPVTAEVTPHHLLLTDEIAALADPRYKVNPPLRSDDDVLALREAVLDGTIDAVATDHAPHTAESKDNHWCDAPFGMIGLETAAAVVAYVLADCGGLDWRRFAELTSTTPARIGRIADFAGRPLAVGEPANFALVNSDHTWSPDTSRRFSRSSNTPFPTFEFSHKVVGAVCDGVFTHVDADGGLSVGDQTESYLHRTQNAHMITPSTAEGAHSR